MSDPARGILLAGVGGQGTVLASTVVAETMLAYGYDVKQSEVHGMAQRGGSVVSHVRFGTHVASPLIPLGTAEILVAFEWAEALRWLPYVAPGGAVVVDTTRIVPPMACRDRQDWMSRYPMMEPEEIGKRVGEARPIDASGIAAEVGNVKAANSVLLGATASLLDIPDRYWEAAIRRRVPPTTIELNLECFKRGRQARAVHIERPATYSTESFVGPAPYIDVTRDWCKSCNICVRVCPEYVLALDEEGIVVATSPDLCTGCQLCQILCPDFAITIEPAVTAGGVR